MKTRITSLAVCCLFLFLSFSLMAEIDISTQATAEALIDFDGDGYFSQEDCDDSNAALYENCPLLAYTDCTNANRFENQCLPVVSDVEGMLKNLENLAMDPDRFAWDDFLDGSGHWVSPARPSDDPMAFIGWSDFLDFFVGIIRNPLIVAEKIEQIYFDFCPWCGGWDPQSPNKYMQSFQMAKKHLQSIQYIDKGPYTDGLGDKRYLVTSISDETDYAGDKFDEAALQLIQADDFGSEDGVKDRVVAQKLLNDDIETARYNHPGGSQLIGEYLFLALENFADPDSDIPVPGLSVGDKLYWPSTGVWKVDLENEQIEFLYTNLTKPDDVTEPDEKEIPSDDNHQSTAAVTRLADGTFLLAACVYKDCDYINFYKSTGTTLATNPGFQLVGRWVRPIPDPENVNWWRDEWNSMPPEDNWSDCAPQNMNFAVQSTGEIYLVMFGGVDEQAGLISCDTLVGFQDTIYGYKIDLSFSKTNGVHAYAVKFQHTNKLSTIPGRHSNTKFYWRDLRSIVWVSGLHGLNLLAGSGLWLGPGGRDDIAFFATEHYDSARSYKRPVDADSRWGVSSNWDREPQIWVDNYLVEVDEGDIATNTGSYETGDAITLSASVGAILKDSADTWSWSWLGKDGPDDSQSVTVRRSDDSDSSDSANFTLIVNNVPPTADAGPDKTVECVYGEHIPVDATGSSDPGEDILSFAWAFSDVPGNSAPPFDDPASATTSFLPNALGTYLAEVTVTDDDDASDMDNVVILFEDTTPPVISSVSATPNVLWPPNGKMVEIEASVTVVDACDIAPVCAIAKIESNEPETRTPDSEIAAPFTAKLRAKRLGTGSDRTYTIFVECSDFAGNSTIRTTTVTVPHDQDSVKG